MSTQTQGKQDPKIKHVTIVINGRQRTVEDKELSFEELVRLAYDGTPPSGEFTITYRRGHGNKPDGSLVAGETVKVREGMIFDVYGTDKS